MGKKILMYRTVFGLLPKLYCEKKKYIFCIASLAIVLQALQLYCKREGWKNYSENCIAIHCIVLQRSKLRWLNLGCNTLEYIAIEAAGLA